jgi:dienelactone hydrolase
MTPDRPRVDFALTHGFHAAMPRALPWICGAALLIHLGSAAWLGSLERGGPAHAEVMLDGGIPATLYLPREGGREAFLDAPPRDERPPGVVLMHGFASDRLGVSTLARRVAAGGYAVLAFDASGHGQNRNPFARSFARPDAFFADYTAAVDFLRSSVLVDGGRLAVMGHSMGAGASLDFATRDAGIDATVLISGGFSMQGPHRPPNALFLVASGDPQRIQMRAAELAARLAEVPAVEVGRRYGDVALGTGVRVAEVGGADHATIVWSRPAADEIRAWLDAAFERAGGSPAAADPRLLAALLAFASLVLVLPGLGVVIGRLVPRADARPAASAAAGLAWIAAALVATLPLLAVDTPAALLSIEVGDVIVSHLALAGLALCAALALRGDLPLRGALREPARTAGGALLGMAAVYVLLLPVGAVVHRMTLTPERALVFAASAPLLLPFSISSQWLLRRGGVARASACAVAGRALLVASLLLGVATGLLPSVVTLMLPSLVIVFVLFELLSCAIYAASRNLAVIAAIDSAWLALVIATVLPIRI